MAKLAEGDTISMTGEVTLVRVSAGTVRLHGYSVPITTTGEHLSLVAKRKAERMPGLRDVPD